MTISNTRSILYKLARLLGDVQAAKRGKVARRVAGRATGRLLRRLFR